MMLGINKYEVRTIYVDFDLKLKFRRPHPANTNHNNKGEP
jgi:hypothetical protein